MKNQSIYLLWLLMASVGVQAQTVNLTFPYFAGKTYEFKIFQGDKHITLKTDTIRQGGKLQLVIPNQYAPYVGIAQWYLTNNKMGGGLDLIINKQDFSVSCLDSIPTNKSIIYRGSSDTNFSSESYIEQQKIFQKHDAMLAATRAYPKGSKLHTLFNTEYQHIISQYAVYAKKIASSSLYAAKFRQIVNITMGIGTIITQNEQGKANNINDFIVNQLDYSALYTSNHWGGVINNWVQLQTMVLKNDRKLLQDTKTILNRIPSDKIYTDFVINLTKELSKAGKDNVLADLTPSIKNANRLVNYDGVLGMYAKDLTGKAPNLSIIEHLGKVEAHNHSTQTIETDKLESKYTLIVFYKSGCGPCEETMQGLQGNYKDLTSKGLRIISIAADTDEQVFKNTSSQFPWADKYCNLDGMGGENFKNYVVLGTPTLFLIDKDGIIIKKMATLKEVLTFMNK